MDVIRLLVRLLIVSGISVTASYASSLDLANDPDFYVVADPGMQTGLQDNTFSQENTFSRRARIQTLVSDVLPDPLQGDMALRFVMYSRSAFRITGNNSGEGSVQRKDASVSEPDVAVLLGAGIAVLAFQRRRQKMDGEERGGQQPIGCHAAD